MPIGVMMFSIATPRLVEEHREDPVELEARLRRILRDAYPGARLIGRLYFEVGRERALALVKDLDLAEPIKRKAVLSTFGASYRKLLEPEEAKEARLHEKRYETLEPEPEDREGESAA